MINWRKSSFSGTEGNCVEVGWRNSSYSGPNGDCVEVAHAPLGVLVRDSKNTGGAMLAFAPVEWRAFLSRTPGRASGPSGR